MKTKQIFKATLSVMVSAFFVALAVAGVARATTVGTNISTGTLTLVSTTNPQLTAKYDTSNYLSASVSSAGVVTFDALGGNAANFLFSDDIVLATTTTTQLKVGYDTSNFLAFQTGSTGTTTLVARGDANAALLFSSPLRVATSSAFALQVRDANQRGILEVNALAGYVGIGTSTPPSYALHVSTSTTPQFVLANDRLNYLSFSVGTSGTTTLDAVGGDGLYTGIISNDPFRISTSSRFAFEVQDTGGTGTTTFTVDTLNNRVGIGSSTPSAMLSVGNQEANGNRLGSSFGTSTIDIGRACFRSVDMRGTTFYWWFDLNDGTLIATGTTSCF